MSHLDTALQSLGVHGKFELSGRLAIIQGDRCLVYVIQGSYGDGYYTWCGAEDTRKVQFHRDPVEAIKTGLERASKHWLRETYDDTAKNKVDTIMA